MSDTKASKETTRGPSDSGIQQQTFHLRQRRWLRTRMTTLDSCAHCGMMSKSFTSCIQEAFNANDHHDRAILLTSGLLFIHPLSLVRANELNAGTARGVPEPASPDTTPMIGDNPFSQSVAGDVQERGVLPGLVAPNAMARQPGLAVLAPTPSLTAVRNALRVTAKSISVNLRLPPNLPVTVPIEVSVAYLSSVHTQRLTKVYSPTSGLTLLYREAEGDGTPRAMTVDITVRELVPNGKSFAISKQFKIIPLYQATISPLRFNMATKCDTVGKSDITFEWINFLGRHEEQNFDLGFGQTKMVNHFNSGRSEFSTEANLKEPVMRFFERDLTLPGSTYHPPLGTSGIPLVPGPSKEFSFFLDQEVTGPPARQHSGSTKCKAHISYRIDRSVMRFDQF